MKLTTDIVQNPNIDPTLPESAVGYMIVTPDGRHVFYTPLSRASRRAQFEMDNTGTSEWPIYPLYAGPAILESRA